MTEERLNEIKKDFHQAIIDNALADIKFLKQSRYIGETEDKIAKLDERIRKSMIVLESIK